MTKIDGNAAVYQNQTDNKPAKTSAVTVNTEKAATLSADQVNVSVQKGIVPTFKGAGVGALGAGAATLAAVAIYSKGDFSGWGGLVATGIVLGGAAAGAITGGITANSTTNKGTGAIIGAVTGGVTGAVLAGISGRSLTGAAFGLVAGGVAGAIGGLGGSWVAKTK